MNMINVGLIGVGGQAKKHINAISKSNFGRIVAVCDTNSVEAQNVGKQIGCPYFTSYKEMITKVDLDVVFICVPHNFHLEMSIYALENGLHVIKEKPFARNVEEGNKVISSAIYNSKSVFTISQRRFHPSYILAKEKLEEIGSIYLVDGEYIFNGPPYNYGWRGVKSIAGGGAVLDMGYHMLDIFLWYFGNPETLYALSTNKGREAEYETEDTAIISMKYKTFLSNLLLSRVSNPESEKFTIFGTKGVLEISRTSVKKYTLFGELKEEYYFDRNWQNALKNQIDYFLEKIKTGELNFGNDQMDHLKLIDFVYKSIKEDTVSNLYEKVSTI